MLTPHASLSHANRTTFGVPFKDHALYWVIMLIAKCICFLYQPEQTLPIANTQQIINVIYGSMFGYNLREKKELRLIIYSKDF